MIPPDADLKVKHVVTGVELKKLGKDLNQTRLTMMCCKIFQKNI